jgi:hypothetical protein
VIPTGQQLSLCSRRPLPTIELKSDLRLAIALLPVEKIVATVRFMNPGGISLIGFAVLFALSGPRLEAISVNLSMDLYNNTEYPVELVHARKGSTLETIFPGKSKIVPFNDGVTIKVDGRQLHFDRVDPPKEYARKGLLSMTWRGQLNPDLKILLLPLSAKRPALNLPQQPPGFPLLPR